MKKFTVESGLVMPLDRANVDTDFIIPKQFLKSIKRSGFGVNLFDEHRYLDKGEPDTDNRSRPLNPDFVLNQARYQVRRSCWREITSAAVRRESMRPGRWTTTVLELFWRRAMRTSFLTTVSRTAFYQSFFLVRLLTSCSRRWLQMKGTPWRWI